MSKTKPNIPLIKALRSRGWGYEDIAVFLDYKRGSNEFQLVKDMVLGKFKKIEAA